MTRRDFGFIAATLKEARARAGSDIDAIDTVEEVARVFAERLLLVNPNFNRARFLAACGVEG